MNLLTAINRILPALGEHQVTRVDTKHPTLAIILPILQSKLDETLQRGWWFNEFPYTLHPNNEGEIDIPDDTLAFIPDSAPGVVRGPRLFNQGELNYKWAGPVPGTIVQRWEFDELPESLATYIFYSTLVQAYITDIGLEAVLNEWKIVEHNAETNATQEHLRNKRYSTRKSPRYIRLRRAMRGH